MQLQLATDYAIRILSYMYQQDNKLSTAVSMSESLGITYLYFMKIISRLKGAGMVDSVQGCNGGYKLANKRKKISVYDVVCVMEGGISINRCLQEDLYCSRNAAPECKVHQYFKSLQGQIVDSLKGQCIADF